MSEGPPLKLHGYWRSGTSYRTRIALNLKGIAYHQLPVDLRKGEQAASDYRTLNPQELVPALETPDGTLIQSSAIIEWLEERYPEPALLPVDPAERATVRAMAMLIACDVHPLGNLRILKYLKHELGQPQEAIDQWIDEWISRGFAALETLVARHGGTYAFGDQLTLADCHIVPQFYSAERFDVDTQPYPCLSRAVEAARAHPAVAAAHPDRQPDAD